MIIDLSVPINEQTPVYPGDPETQVRSAGKLAEDGYIDHYVSFGTHVGTHIDAPMHMLEHGKSLDQVPIDCFVGNGICLDIRKRDFAIVRDEEIHERDIVLFYTGMGSKFDDSIYFEKYPAMSQEIAEYLVQNKVKMVGFDTCSADNQEGFPIHKTLLSGSVLIIENLTNLDQLVGKRFETYALPMKLQLDGAPARVIAIF